MRRLIFFLFLVSIFFAATVSDNNNRVTLYREDSAGNDEIVQDLDFSHTLGLSSSGRILVSADNNFGDGVEDGDTICPSTVTASSAYTGDWAAPYFHAVVLYDLPTSCSRPDDDTVPSNEDIRWDDADYDAFINQEPCQSNEPECWGREEPTIDTRIDQYYKSASQVYNDRLGHVAVICTASDRLRKSGPGADFDQTRTTTSNAGFSQSLSLSSTGDYRIRDKFTINGCMLVVRYPDCASGRRARIFSRTTNAENGPEYSNSGLAEHDIDVTVDNRQQSLQVLSTDPPSGSTVTIPPGDSQLVRMQVRNNGDVTNRVTGVSATNGFTTTPTACPGGPSGDGISENMAVNGEETVCFFLTAPSYSGTTSTRISLTYEALARTCSATSPDVKTLNVTFSSIEEGPTGPYCSIPEDGASLQQDDTFRFNLNCFDEDDNPILCANTLWTFAGIAADVVEDEDDHLTLTMTSNGTGTLNANVSSSFACDATFTVSNDTVDPCPTPPCPPGIDNGCTLSPRTTYMHPDERIGFNLVCENNPGGVCNSPAWNTNPAFATVESSSDSFALVRSGNNVGSGILEVTTDDGTNFCTANITISYAICADFI